MPDEEERPDDASPRPPLPPEDRLWRHPSEIGSAAAERATPATDARSDSRGGSRWGLVAAGLIGAGLTLGVVAFTGTFRREVVERPVAPAAQLSGPTPVSAPVDVGVSHLVNGIRSSVAGVRATGGANVRTGSAVVLGPAGHLVTSKALVDGATEVTVTFADGSTAAGTVTGDDPTTGLAVLSVPKRPLTTPVVSRRRPDVGSVSVALAGSTNGATGLVSAGVVRGLGQHVASAGGDLRDLIQTDQATSSETDGGAMIGADGAVSGICLDPSDDPADPASRSGWAVPIDVAEQVVDDIVTDGRAHHAWLGVEISDADSSPSLTHPGQPAPQGAAISSVSPGSPAEGAELRAGDRITAIGGTPVTAMADVISVLRRHRPGDKVALDYQRDGQAETVTVVLRDLAPR